MQIVLNEDKEVVSSVLGHDVRQICTRLSGYLISFFAVYRFLACYLKSDWACSGSCEKTHAGDASRYRRG